MSFYKKINLDFTHNGREKKKLLQLIINEYKNSHYFVHFTDMHQKECPIPCEQSCCKNFISSHVYFILFYDVNVLKICRAVQNKYKKDYKRLTSGVCGGVCDFLEGVQVGCHGLYGCPKK